MGVRCHEARDLKANLDQAACRAPERGQRRDKSPRRDLRRRPGRASPSQGRQRLGLPAGERLGSRQAVGNRPERRGDGRGLCRRRRAVGHVADPRRRGRKPAAGGDDAGRNHRSGQVRALAIQISGRAPRHAGQPESQIRDGGKRRAGGRRRGDRAEGRDRRLSKRARPASFSACPIRRTSPRRSLASSARRTAFGR